MDVWSPPVKRRVRAAMLGFPPDDRWHGRSFAPRGDFLFDDTRQSVGGEQLQRGTLGTGGGSYQSLQCCDG
jgi:hypothetical protein